MRKRIVVMGGGTGTFTVLSGLKHQPVDLSAVVSIADDGGSTGILRDELDVLPPGDIRMCLVALSRAPETLRKLMNHQFRKGSLAGHKAGNIFLSGLEEVMGDPLLAIEEAHQILNVHGQVIPVASQAADLLVELQNGCVFGGESIIDRMEKTDSPIRRCFFKTPVVANPKALKAILEADVVVIGPGDVYTSLIPVLLVEGIRDALARTAARIIFVLNLVTKPGYTEGFTAAKFFEVIKMYLDGVSMYRVIVNCGVPEPSMRERYESAGERLVQDDLPKNDQLIVRRPLLAGAVVARQTGDLVKRSLIRHDSDLLAQAIMECL